MAKRRRSLARTMTFVSYPSPGHRRRARVVDSTPEFGLDDSSAGLKGGVGRGSPTPDEHPADLRQSDGDLQDELAASVREVSTAVAALEGRARDESRKRDAETDALHAKLDRLLAALDAKG